MAAGVRCSCSMRRYGQRTGGRECGAGAQLGDGASRQNKDLVLDTSGVGQIFGFSEVVPLVDLVRIACDCQRDEGSRDGFPLARTIDVKAGGKWTGEKLFSSSANSFATTNLAAREIQIDPTKDKKGPFILAAAASGGQGRFVVVGSSGWVANSFFGFNGNRDLFLNMVNWLSSDEELISIRPKDPEDRRLSINRSQMTMIFYTSVILMPLAVIPAGVSVWWKRR